MTFTIGVSLWVVLQLFILPVALPLIVGLVTKYSTSSTSKALLLLALSIASSTLTELLDAFNSGAETYDIGLALIRALVTFGVGAGVHFGLLKPTGLTDKVQAIGNSEGSLANSKTIDG